MVRIFTNEDREKALEIRRKNKEIRETSPRIEGVQQTLVKSENEPYASKYTPTPVPRIDSEAVARKREELELARMEAELSAIKNPPADTRMDYIQELLKLQQQHNEQMLNIQAKNFDTQLQLAKLEYGNPQSNDFFDVVEIISPFLPAIAEGMKLKNAQTSVQGSNSSIPAQKIEKVKEVKKVEMPNMTDVEAYKDRIRKGLVTKEQAWIDFQQQLPPQLVQQVGKEGFEREFDKIFNEGKNLNTSTPSQTDGIQRQ